MAMMPQLPSASSKAIVQLAKAAEEESAISHLAGRLIQITLALYLLPALLAVLAVGGVGIFILKFIRFFSGPLKMPVD